MLLPRIIPCLLLTKEGLVKTQKFKNPVYVGDPINAVKIFNEKKADELIILDIGATKNKYEPNFILINKIAREARMPICYGGGIKNLDQAKNIFNFGIEKIAISSVFFSDDRLVSKISEYAGSQSVVVILDVKKINNKYSIFINNGTKEVGNEINHFIKKIENCGAGEIVINSIDRDGTMIGYDYDLIDQIFSITKIPLTVVGGGGTIEDIKKTIKKYGNIGIACGSLFVFKGPRKAVLINYPSKIEKKEIMSN